jgi:hypothetical protein
MCMCGAVRYGSYFFAEDSTIIDVHIYEIQRLSPMNEHTPYLYEYL